ncbi:PAS domain-containing protein [Flagellimonas pacifica]|uniref:PAS domain S-box-containing protein n=1 Tax=Flagellimonas pacifica TaxID=1247520 RepID=A0A285MFW2_9FLAO|nr:PAS domain-containing protein [Allomuricauda parva]SNY94836.1 PAS domain S-box-containing protein [Allomuricauda parva]
MENTKFYDQAVSNFYSDKEINGYPISSLDIYAQHFGRVCKNLHDIKNLNALAKREKWKGSLPLRTEILDKEHIVVVTDADLNIVYATQNMHQMNGYMPDEVVGKKPNMFQGEATCRKTTKLVSQAIKNRKPFEVTLVNYRKNGTVYNCKIKGVPVFDITGKVVNFIAFEKEVA